MNLVFDDGLAKWAAEHMEAPENPFGPCRAIGVHDRKEIIAVCVYHRYVPEYESCEISFASISPRWAQRGIIRALLSVPFEQYGLWSVSTCTPATNKRALKFNEGIGLINPIEIPHGCGRNKPLIIRTMTRDEYHLRYGYTKAAA